MCARELLTLGKNCELRLDTVPENKKFPNDGMNRFGSIPNLDGNFSESSDAESDSENHDLLDKSRASNFFKSTVEGSCPSVLTRKYSKKEGITLNKVNVKSNKLSDEQLMAGEYPPGTRSSLKNTLSKYHLESSGSDGHSGMTRNINLIVSSTKSEGINNPVYRTTSLSRGINDCDSMSQKVNVTMNSASTSLTNSPNTATAITNVIAYPTSMSSTPGTVCLPHGGGGQIVAVSGMNLASNPPPMLVFSSGSNFPGQLSTGNAKGNLILGNFGAAVPMALIPGRSGDNKNHFQGSPIGLPNADVLNVPVSVSGGKNLVTLSHPMTEGMVIKQEQAANIPLTFTSIATPSIPVSSISAPLATPSSSVNIMPEDSKFNREPKLESSIAEDGSVIWPCNVCAKICPSESDLKIHKKRHKIDEALICSYCKRSYVDKHRYDVHVRMHTGETPFHCSLCGKGFRDDRKMKLHMARHNSGLSHKCHLCPRSFEGPKALEKHLNAHATGRYVAPKVIQKSDGTTAMALPEDKQKESESTTAAGISTLPQDMLGVGEIDPLVSDPGGIAIFQDNSQLTRLTEGISFDLKSEGSKEDDSVSACSSMISLSMEDLYQYNVSQSGLEASR